MPGKALNYFLEPPDWNPIAPTIELRIPKIYPANVPSKNVSPSWLIRPFNEVNSTIPSINTAMDDNATTVLNQYSYLVCSCRSPLSRYTLARSMSSSPFLSITLATATLRGLGWDLALQVSCSIFSNVSGVTGIGCWGCDSTLPPKTLSIFDNLTLLEVSEDGLGHFSPRLPVRSGLRPANRPAPEGRDEEEMTLSFLSPARRRWLE